jgi:hypothetical protein
MPLIPIILWAAGGSVIVLGVGYYLLTQMM